jgi:hypothetical protein
MHLVRTHPSPSPGRNAQLSTHRGAPLDAPSEPATAPTLEQTVRELDQAGHSQRAIARDLSIDRRKVKNIICRAGQEEAAMLAIHML